MYGATEQSGGADAQMADLADELAERAAEVAAPALVASIQQIRRRFEAGRPPVGLDRLAEVLRPGPTPPAPRQPVGDPAAAADCVRRHPATVLEGQEPAAVAAMLAALVHDGLRTLVTGQDAGHLAAVRDALPGSAAALCLEGPEPLSATELRELRALLATATPDRRRRPDQLLPVPAQVPDAALVARLCRSAGKASAPATDSAGLVPELLGTMRADRLNSLIDTARQCDIAVSAINRDGRAPWSWELLEELVFGQSRPVFDRLLGLCTETIRVADTLRDVGDQLAVVGTIEPESLELVRKYADWLDAGNRSRSYFRSPEQRAAEPALRQLRLDRTPLKNSTLLRQALTFVELIEDVERLGADCRLLELPEPSDIPAVIRLKHSLDRVEQAAMAVETLRHEVLFIHPNSPIAMPDMATTEAVAQAIINSGSAAEMAAARRQLTTLTDQFAQTLPARLYAETVRVSAGSATWGVDPGPGDTGPRGGRPDRPGDDGDPTPAPEYLAAVRALRELRLADYDEAVRGMAAARREQLEERRLGDLLARLRAAAPGLAEAWQRTGGRTFAPGTVRFQPLAELLAGLPESDTADVVLLLGADELDAGYLAVTAAAPRLLAAATGTPAAPATVSGGPADSWLGTDEDTVATVLRRAGVPVITVAAGAVKAKEPAA